MSTLACVPRGCGELGVRVESALLWSWNPTRPIRAHQAFASLPVRRLGAVPVQLRNGEVGKPKATSGKKRARRATRIRDWRPGLPSAEALLLKRLMQLGSNEVTLNVRQR